MSALCTDILKTLGVTDRQFVKDLIQIVVQKQNVVHNQKIIMQ